MQNSSPSSVIVLGFSLLLGMNIASSQDTSADPVSRWITKLDSCKTLSGSFEEERKMRTVRRPITKAGQFFYAQPGDVRWSVGSGKSQVLAVKNGNDVTVLRPGKKTARRYSMKDVEENNQLRGLAFLRSGFPQSRKAFDKDFEVLKSTQEKGFHVVETRMRDPEARRALRKVTFYIHDASSHMTAFRLFFRDGSTSYTKLIGLKENAEAPKNTFSVDLKGYTIEKD